MNKEYLKNVIIDQREEIGGRLKKEETIAREGFEICRLYIKHPNILLISGMRRAGKSFFSHLLVGRNNYAFLNFDDERLIEFKTKDFNVVLECFYELYGNFDYIVFDEIQNIRGWELFVSRLRGKFKIIITGSNANLLSKELATHLTGRFSDFVLFPLNFREFMKYNHLVIKDAGLYSTKERSGITALFEKYLKSGGIFEYYKFGGEFLRNLWSSIITKDIAVRYKIKYPHILEEL
jgi:predicted AAA+ superfamily ATPase